jgi:biotin carboxyl carrier protein
VLFEIDINGKTRKVSVEKVGPAGPEGGRFRVLVDGEPADVDARRTGLGLSLVFGDQTSVDVGMTPRSGGEWFVQLPHADISAAVDVRRHQRGDAGGVSKSGAQRITAPMPGRVVRILVKPGDEVAHRQGLIVVEAMKMENELGAPKAGKVKEVAVTEGQSVEAGRLLIVIE